MVKDSGIVPVSCNVVVVHVRMYRKKGKERSGLVYERQERQDDRATDTNPYDYAYQTEMGAR